MLLRAGDTAVAQGVNHAWSNRSDKPCMIMAVMVHFDARRAEQALGLDRSTRPSKPADRAANALLLRCCTII